MAPFNLSPNMEVVVSVIAYSICSGSLVLLNKLILHRLPYPSLVITFQLCAALVFIFSAKAGGLLQVDPLKWEHVVPYLYYIVAFAMGVYCNMRSLSVSNVETVIVFRALAPCLVAFLDAIFLGREYPSKRSWGGIGLIVCGAYGYASFDKEFQTQGVAAYFWPVCYMCIISFEMAYGKKIIRSVDLKTLSGPVMYTNLLGITPMLLFAGMGGEFSKFHNDVVANNEYTLPSGTVPLMLVGCAVGTGIGYSSWWCRDKVSATSFTIVGVMNKCLTILMNYMVWDNHAKPAGIACLFLCLVGGSVYQQAPMRASTRHYKIAAVDSDDIWGDDMSVLVRDEEKDEQQDLLNNRQKKGGNLNKPKRTTDNRTP
ncbi:mannose transporter GONST3 [Seminavis robusta]|uniref:Mannose transporter GONST3 n=1 Tax=Seminavis robusta TaxID=568900 RepID=A0A9N8EIU6_9STRA|nr:mannose transporter GONST3 [Seminavis robusta]|eukprot:Sro1205_g252300.1 mannose transporter GONST3 (370) ;mRNA; f:25767-27006